MRVQLQLLLVYLLLFCPLLTSPGYASDPETPAGIPIAPVFEDGFEVFVGCGDGLVLAAEECDDQNRADGDGCNSSCGIESGFICNGQPSACETQCGDGVLAGSEQCDDYDADSGDGCDSSCNIESGFICNGQPSACSTECGDGLIRGMEQCDDSSRLSGDGCDFDCNIEEGYSCSDEPSVCSPDT